MEQEMKKDYDSLKEFWNSAMMMDEEEFEKEVADIDVENDWKQMAPSEKLLVAVESLKDKKKVLDYGCGTGWAAIAAAKYGCKNVLGVEVVENAVKSTKLLVKAFQAEEQVEVQHISDTWLSEAKEDCFDGIVCSNVIDVLPDEVAFSIIENLAKVATKDGSIIIGMNAPARSLESNPEQGLEVKNGNYLYVNGVLRMVSRTDEEWAEIFSKYFNVEKIEHFAWPQETEERRRIFYLRLR